MRRLYKKITSEIRKNRRDQVISTENSFSYENIISIKFSMYKVHTKSIKVCRISNNMVQYKEKERGKNNISLYVTKVFRPSKVPGLTYSTF